MNDQTLEQKIIGLQHTIQTWAEKKGLWTDSFFKSYFEEFDDEPNVVAACVSVLITEGGLGNMFNGYSYPELQEAFEALVDTTEFYYESYNHYTYCFYCKEDELNQAYVEYFEWQWINELVKPDYTSLYQELFDYFNKKPESLYRLSSRKFEILLSEVFRNQGYKTELGKGQGDNGVDIRLFKKDGIDEIVTLVQAKKYKPGLPIKMEGVAALSGIVHTEKASSGLFVTTSRYLPVTQRFAARENSLVTLADTNDVTEWCRQSRNLIQRDKSALFSDSNLLDIIKLQHAPGLLGKVVTAASGYDMVRNDFCIIVKDTPHVALLMRIPSFVTQYNDAPYNNRGYEIAQLSDQILSYRTKENIFRAKKILRDGRVNFWGEKQFYVLWDEKALYFDHVD